MFVTFGRREAVNLQREMCALFQGGGFLLCKWSCYSSDQSLLKSIPDSQATIILSDSDQDQYSKTLGIASDDHFRVCVTELPLAVGCMTKRSLVDDVARTFDALGWYSPTIIKAKILLQRLWLEKIGWDDRMVSLKHGLNGGKSCHYFQIHVVTTPRKLQQCVLNYTVSLMPPRLPIQQLFTFEQRIALASFTLTSIAMSKTRVAPIKRITIPRLELNRALK